MNPLILLDEIDKMSHGIQGDPASALLEVLDPEQNKDFLDHYLDVRLDLSKVLFICTANDISAIPEALRDRMEIIRLSGYIEQEKLHIARSYLVPKQRKEHGLSSRQVSVHNSALKQLVRHYAREAGVRRAEQQLAKIMRKVATHCAQQNPAESNESRNAKKNDKKQSSKITITADSIADYLGEPPLSDEELMTHPTPGVITGLAWTAMGGATLEIEALAIPVAEAGRSGMRLSGQLGDVMQESGQLALSYLRAHANELGIDPQWFDQHALHLHVPAGATPKDGPSAGITMGCALYSLARKQAPRARVGMTGELTLTGRVFPIGGVREKIVAARRAGLRRILLPAGNRGAWQELPEYLRKGLDVHLVEHFSEVLPLVFGRG